TDDQRRLYHAVNDPMAINPLYRFEMLSELETGVRALQEVVIELATADAITDGFVVMRLHFRSTHEPDAETGNRLQHAPYAVVLQVDVELVHYGGGDPAGADLVTREVFLIQDQNVEPGSA